MTQEEEIKDLEKLIAIMQSDASQLQEDLAHWKKVAAGLKGYNKQLAERVEHYKQLDLEGDELYEKSLAEIDGLKSVIKEKDAIIIGLESQARKISETVQEQSERIKRLKNDISVFEENLEHYMSLPWWKKIFM